MNADEPILRGRGRPKSDGRHLGTHLLRNTVAAEAYHAVRSKGGKHDVAVKAAVAEVRRVFPQMRCSVSLIKQVLAECMSSDPDRLSMVVTAVHRTPEQRQVNPKGPALPAVTYGIGLDKRPAYPRANAAVNKTTPKTTRSVPVTESEPRTYK